MAGTIEIELARDSDREVLLNALAQEGLEPVAGDDGRSIELPCNGDAARATSCSTGSRR